MKLIRKGITTYEYVVAMRAMSEAPAGSIHDDNQNVIYSPSGYATTGFSGGSSLGLQYKGAWCTPPKVDLDAKEKTIPRCDFYYDMSYSPKYSTFANLPTENTRTSSETSSSISSELVTDGAEDSSSDHGSEKSEMKLLDLYSGCGAMSTGLCLGANIAGVNLVTRWAVDLNEYACQSLKENHAETEVRNEKAEDFLLLLKEWEKLCKHFSLLGNIKVQSRSSDAIFCEEDDEDIEEEAKTPSGEFEVGKLVGNCFGDLNEIGVQGLKFKVRWKGYGPCEDTWEPIDGLRLNEN